jgi:Mg2+ and Co2+ transporter CorA
MQNMSNTNQIVNAINGGIQSIKDQLCDYRNAQKDDTIANLRQELMYSRGQASQVEQTAQLLANNNAQTALFQQGLNNEVDALYNRLSNCPVPTVPVYGRQPIFTCPQNQGCGCGCGNGFAN